MKTLNTKHKETAGTEKQDAFHKLFVEEFRKVYPQIKKSGGGDQTSIWFTGSRYEVFGAGIEEERKALVLVGKFTALGMKKEWFEYIELGYDKQRKMWYATLSTYVPY